MSTHVQVQCTQVQATPDSTVDVVTRTVLREELENFATETFKRELITVVSDRVVDVVRQQLQMVGAQASNLRNTASMNTLNTNGFAPEIKNLGSLQWPGLINLLPPRQLSSLPHGDEPPGVGRSASRESKDDPWSFEIRRASIKKPTRPSLSESSQYTEDAEDIPAFSRHDSDRGPDVTAQLSSNKPWVPGCPGKPSQEANAPWRFEIRRSTSTKAKAEEDHSDSENTKDEQRDSTRVARCSSVALKPDNNASDHTPESPYGRLSQKKEGAAPAEKKEEAATRQESTESSNPKVSRSGSRSGNLRELVLQPQDNTQDDVSSLHSCAVASFSVCSNFQQAHKDVTVTDGTRSTTSVSSRRPVEEETSGMGFSHHAQNWVMKEEMQLIQHETGAGQFNEKGSERSSLSGFLLPRCIEAARWKKSIKRFVRSPQLDYGSTVLILLNSLVLGIQTDMAAQTLNEDDHIAFKITEYTFGFCFLVELVLKIYVHKGNFFWKPGCSWNYFDCLVVGIQVVEVVMSIVAHFMEAGTDSETGGFGMMRILRILRLVRVLRMVRIMHLVSELRTIIVAISSSMRSLGWTMLLLLLLVYLIGVYLTQLVTTARKSENCTGKCERQLTLYFGTLARTLLVLYQIITGGIDWSEVTEPLMEHISVSLAILFCFYIAFVVFALMNVVTGVFVEAALKSTKHDQDVVLLHHIRHLLKVIDADHSGTISWEEFESQLYSPDMVRLFKTIDLDPEEARDLFRLIDIDGSGEISSDEFINGCLRLRGPAKAIDMAAFMFDYKRTSTALKEHSHRVEDTLAWITQGGLHQLAAYQTQMAPSTQATTYRIKMSL